MAGQTGIYPQWLDDMWSAGFVELETSSFDIEQRYSHEAWCGRTLASSGIKASIDLGEAIVCFEAKLRALLAAKYPGDPLDVPHRVWWATGQRPSA